MGFILILRYTIVSLVPNNLPDATSAPFQVLTVLFLAKIVLQILIIFKAENVIYARKKTQNVSSVIPLDSVINVQSVIIWIYLVYAWNATLLLKIVPFASLI